MRLYEMANEFKNVRELFECGDIDEQTMKDTLEFVGLPFNEKLKNCLMLMREFEASSAALEAEIDRIKSLQANANKSAESLKKYIAECLELSGTDKVDLGLFKITLKAPTKAVEVFDDSILPADYFVIVPESKRPDKALIDKALKDGFDVSGAKLVDGKRALLIK